MRSRQRQQGCAGVCLEARSVNPSPILLNPGPVTLTSRVKRALTGPDLCHREPEFAELTLDILKRLESVYSTATESYRALLLASSGTGAVEAMLASLACRDRPTIVACNGVYGERIESMLKVQGKPVVSVKSDWLKAVDLEALEKALKDHPEAEHLALIHHETTTGRLNPLEPIGDLCREYGCQILLDAVSSFGAEEIDFEALPLEAVAGTANKCLHGVPGTAFVLLREHTLAAAESRSPSLYLDLFRYADQQKSGFSPFTQAVQSYYALQAALQELEEQGGWRVRRQCYRQRSLFLKDTLAALGAETLLENDVYASMLTSFVLPEGKTYQAFHDELKEDGFITYAGQGKLQGNVFRLATMGEIGAQDLDRLAASLRRSLSQ